MNEHANHRQRLKTRFISQGLDGFNDHQVLELLLFYAIPRIDTNPIAHRLLNEFGSLNGVLEASHEELTAIEGIGDNAATFLKLLKSFERRLGLEKFTSKDRFNSLQVVGDYLVNLFKGETVEKSYLLCFNGKMELIKCALLSEGSPSSTTVSARSIIDVAIKTKASGIILAHNHPNGTLTPSDSDIDMTNQLKYFTRTLEINLLEHIIVAEGSFFPIICSTRKVSPENLKFEIN